VSSSHVSSVQLAPSSLQVTGVPATQPLAPHVSAPLQYRPSSQCALLDALLQLCVCSLHESSVQPTPSSQFGAEPEEHSATPLLESHVSVPLQ
jgi:hypothetical protein